ncbi:MAG: hypothetical protein AAGJ82_13455 [Bacteroidota bacterium]
MTPSEDQLDLRLQTFAQLHDAIPFERVITWVYHEEVTVLPPRRSSTLKRWWQDWQKRFSK